MNSDLTTFIPLALPSPSRDESGVVNEAPTGDEDGFPPPVGTRLHRARFILGGGGDGSSRKNLTE